MEWAEHPAREIEELLGRVVDRMNVPPDGELDIALRQAFGPNHVAGILARGRAEALIAMLQEPAVRATIDHLCIQRRRTRNAERKARG